MKPVKEFIDDQKELIRIARGRKLVLDAEVKMYQASIKFAQHLKKHKYTAEGVESILHTVAESDGHKDHRTGIVKTEAERIGKESEMTEHQTQMTALWLEDFGKAHRNWSYMHNQWFDK